MARRGRHASRGACAVAVTALLLRRTRRGRAGGGRAPDAVVRAGFDARLPRLPSGPGVRPCARPAVRDPAGAAEPLRTGRPAARAGRPADPRPRAAHRHARAPRRRPGPAGDPVLRAVHSAAREVAAAARLRTRGVRPARHRTVGVPRMQPTPDPAPRAHPDGLLRSLRRTARPVSRRLHEPGIGAKTSSLCGSRSAARRCRCSRSPTARGSRACTHTSTPRVSRARCSTRRPRSAGTARSGSPRDARSRGCSTTPSAGTGRAAPSPVTPMKR